MRSEGVIAVLSNGSQKGLYMYSHATALGYCWFRDPSVQEYVGPGASLGRAVTGLATILKD
jgi:hypothetical protein